MAESTRFFKPKKSSFEASMAVIIGRGNLYELLIHPLIVLNCFSFVISFYCFYIMANSLQESKLE